MRKQIVLITVVAIVLTIGVGWGAWYLLERANPADPANQAAQANQAEATETTAEVAPEEVPDRPDCTAPTVGGIELECLGGETTEASASMDPAQITVVNLWAWWCAPCRDELPHIEAYAQQHPDVRVVGVHADQHAGRGTAMLNEMGLELTSYQDDDNTFAGTLGLPGVIPITVVFRGEEQLAMYPTPFSSVAEIADAVDSAVAG